MTATSNKIHTASSKAPEISIIVPVYNVEKYLPECLDSLINQTLKNIEIICVNDGSTDNSQKILDKYAEKDQRIKVIVQKNAGLSAARNTGVRNATGEYLCYVDSDDALVLNACEILWTQIEITQADIVVFGLKDMVKAPVDEWFNKVSSPRNGFFTPFTPWALLYENGAYPYACRNCFRRSMLKRHNVVFDETVKYGEDIVYQFCSFPHAHRIQFIPHKLYLYRRLREGSLTQTVNEDLYVRLIQHINMMQHIYTYWKKNGLLDKYAFELNCWILNFLAPDFKHIDKSRYQDTAKKVLRVLPELEKHKCWMNNYDQSMVDMLLKYATNKID